jgi:hypothetical protein
MGMATSGTLRKPPAPVLPADQAGRAGSENRNAPGRTLIRALEPGDLPAVSGLVRATPADSDSHSAGHGGGGELVEAHLLPDMLADGLTRDPDGAPVREPGVEITYRELEQLTNRNARVPARLISPGTAPTRRCPPSG